MVTRPELGGIGLVADDRYALLRIRNRDLARLERHVFQRYPHREWGTFFRFGYRRTTWGMALTYVDGVWPEPDDLDRQPALTRFRDQYSRRAFHVAAAGPLAVGVVHSHPVGYSTRPSTLDDDMDLYFAREFAAYGRGAPYFSLILQRSDAGLTFTGRVYDRGQWLPVRTLFPVGPGVDRINSESHGFETGLSAFAEATTARLQSVLGSRSAQRLSAATVGIIGCSGTGSPLAHVLTRAGIPDFVLVDPQRLAPSNHERHHASYWHDLERDPAPYKVELMRRLIGFINPYATVTAFAGNILHENVQDELLRCEMLVGCSDSQHARAVISDLSHHYLVPALDLGVLMEGKDGILSTQLAEIVLYGPDLPCAFCASRIDTVALAYELMSDDERRTRQEQGEEARARGDDPDQYWRSQNRQLHTVGYLTTALGALGAGYVEGLMTGAFELPHSMLQFDIGCPRFGVVAPPRQRLEGCCCADYLGWADQARAYRNVARPAHWPSRGLLVHRGLAG